MSNRKDKRKFQSEMEHKYNVDLGYLYGDGAKVPFGESGLSRNRF